MKANKNQKRQGPCARAIASGTDVPQREDTVSVVASATTAARDA